MPIKKKFGPKRTFRKKKVWKKKTVGRSKAVASLNRAFPGFSTADPFKPRQNFKLNYVHSFTLTSGTAGTAGVQQRIRLNSLYDPDQTGGGHQPYGFDELAYIWTRYKVNGCLVKLTISDPTEDGVGFAWQLNNPTSSASSGLSITSLSLDKIEERQMASVLRINNTGSQKVVRKFYVPMWKLAGISKEQYRADPDNYTASVTSDPGNLLNMLMAVGSYRGTDTATVTVVVDLTFYATMYQRAVLAQS